MDWTPARAERVLCEIFLSPDPCDTEAHDEWREAARGVAGSSH
ncbi:MAG TPA: hypothetical protein VF576_13910 [Rubricoccaceae bacterium]|jgi:hypothetical protein